MCGIFGYIGIKNHAAQIVFEGLKSLEYRGYDSWGVAVIPNSKIKNQKSKIIVKKKAGKIGNANVDEMPSSNFALGHTRWATHGGVTDTNAHPHLDCTGKIAVVHNGIVENYQEIKKLLETRHKIISQTDTELTAHLIEDYAKKHTLIEAVRLTFLKLRGLSAFLIADTTTQTLIAVKSGPPLVVGLGINENIIASDANAILSGITKVIFIEDGQLAKVGKDKVNIFNVKSGNKITAHVHRISPTQTITTKGEFPHFMLKEIFEQPLVMENILSNFAERITNFANLLKKFPKTYLVGCGSAYYAALISSYIFSKIAKTELTPIIGSEFVYKEPFLSKKTLVVFLSQSGETMDIIGPQKRIKAKGIPTTCLVNVFGSSLYRNCDFKIWLEAGPEICVLSTKAFTAKIAVLGLTAFALANKYKGGQKYLTDTVKQLRYILSKDYQDKYIDPLVDQLFQKEHIFLIGRGISYPLALESALKIKEDSYIHAEGLAGGELKHGPIALAEKGTPYIVFSPFDETYEEILSNAMEVKARGGRIFGVSEKPNEIFDYHLPVKDNGPFTGISQITVIQLLAYKLSVKRGLDPDKPRNLAKSVTVK